MTYTMTTIRKADRLWDDMPLTDVAKRDDMPSEVTLYRWSSEGLISTSTEHRGRKGAWCETVVRRVDALYQHHIAEDVSEVTGVPVDTIRAWARDGRIRAKHTVPTVRDRTLRRGRRAAAQQADGMTLREIGDQWGVTPQAVCYYISVYRDQT